MEHFDGDAQSVKNGLGAWFGIHMNKTGHFVYNDGTEASYGSEKLNIFEHEMR